MCGQTASAATLHTGVAKASARHAPTAWWVGIRVRRARNINMIVSADAAAAVSAPGMTVMDSAPASA